MMSRGFIVLALGGILGTFFACSTPTYIDGQCDHTDPCPTVTHPRPEGSVCDSSGVCVCPPSTRECCPKGAPSGECVTACLADKECEGGGECSTDSECAGPPDAACGKGVCVEGKCALSIQEGPLPSQRYGDCKRRECNVVGAVVEVGDDTDYYDDVNDCTIDACKGGPMNLVLPDETPYPGGGYCYQGERVDCIAWKSNTMCSDGLYCKSTWCVSFDQCSGKCGSVCAPCVDGYPCSADADCQNNHCSGGKCQVSTCKDGRKNGEETGIDCGNGSCALCPDGQGCKVHEDCLNQVCKMGTCQAPTCFDAVQNGAETGVDCGTQACGACGPG